MKWPLSIPPASQAELSPGEEIAQRLAPLVGKPFQLTGKTRTDGSNLRKTVARVLEESSALPVPAPVGAWRIVPPKRKGVPRLLREFVDTFIVTSGTSYNLQVWNRNPSQPTPQIEYADGSLLRANDVRLVFVRVGVARHKIRSVIVATPEYVVEHFGKFGKETVREQLIILPRARQIVLSMKPPILFYPDEAAVARRFMRRIVPQKSRIHETPAATTTLRLRTIRNFVQSKLIGRRIQPSATKNRGQQLEQIVAAGLGYQVTDADVLIGGYPDIRHQALEVKIQDAPTVDLGRYSPQFDEPVVGCPGFTTQTVRYLIAFTDAKTGVCQGAVLCPGRRLAEHFVYVAEKSFKCQRSIPMDFFDQFDGRAVFNPAYP
ncbi:MAG TPA: hypothetical protein VJ783_32350 [Pirellulales bacterium]|nr:hypothetical protein [Pirellulales bacterium]